MTDQITATELRQWLYDGAELALLDVREAGQMAAGHILFSAPLPYSRFEFRLPALVPNNGVRMVLVDAGDGIADKAAARARDLGYSDVQTLAGGVASWAAAGHTLYEGVNVPSKAFGELIELAEHTPRLTAEQVAAMQADGSDMVIVDGRPMAEYRKMNIPGASCCPNGELALRIGRIAPDPATTVVVNCAGRTRSIIGAEILRGAGVPNPVFALENGTQGWTLAGLKLGHGAEHSLPMPSEDLSRVSERTRALAARHGVETIRSQQLGEMLSDPTRTTYLLDVRTAEELENDPESIRDARERLAIAHAPGGQLIQATDQWIGVRNAQIVVLDREGLRALMIASWLRRLGHQAMVVEGGLDTVAGIDFQRELPRPRTPGLPRMPPDALARTLTSGSVQVLDLRSSAAFCEGHIQGAVWTTRARIARAARPGPKVLVADDHRVAAFASRDLTDAGHSNISILAGSPDRWTAAGLAMETSPDQPPEAERIDFIFHTHGRHDGDRAASLAYLAWEVGLVDQLDEQERAVFRV